MLLNTVEEAALLAVLEGASPDLEILHQVYVRLVGRREIRQAVSAQQARRLPMTSSGEPWPTPPQAS